jgi:hypothetical protein
MQDSGARGRRYGLAAAYAGELSPVGLGALAGPILVTGMPGDAIVATIAEAVVSLWTTAPSIIPMPTVAPAIAVEIPVVDPVIDDSTVDGDRGSIGASTTAPGRDSQHRRLWIEAVA